MYKRSNSLVNVTLYTDRGIDCKTLPSRTLPLTLHEFPRFQGFVLEDSSLRLTSVKAIQTNDVMPKDELISIIQSKRVTETKEELYFDFSKKLKTETTKENERMERRRLQNRMAAKRFREKLNTLGTKLQKKTQNVESDNTSLRNQIRKLKKERETLQRHLREHLSLCHYFVGAPIVTSAWADLQGSCA
ncbi:hypothetical protein ACJMK2_007860 [Sinanodonta woodiana]|uniref:BZIP domain-containing protein n=1 Tax=Sinanodonta woodiana TaxID=1069815 RepID=A0ABD3VJS3_SINWO